MFAAYESVSRRNHTSWLYSLVLHIAGVAVLVTLGGALLAPPVHRSSSSLIYIAPPPADTSPTPLPKPKVHAFMLPKPPPPEPVQLSSKPPVLQAPIIQSALVPLLRTVPPILAVALLPQIRTDVLDPPRVASVPQGRPAPSVQIGRFSGISSNEPKQPARATDRPAGFDNGLTQKFNTEPKQNAALTAHPAGFASGVTTQERSSEPTRMASVGAFGGGGIALRQSGSSRREVVSDGGFGSASVSIAESPRPQQQTSQAGFGDTVSVKVQATSERAIAPKPPDSVPILITFKPKPKYTDEARRLQVEGEILIEAIFTASGEVQIVRIIRGLGHGLNESAIAAARIIRFHPAQQQGRPIDSTATVRISFELAY